MWAVVWTPSMFWSLLWTKLKLLSILIVDSDSARHRSAKPYGFLTWMPLCDLINLWIFSLISWQFISLFSNTSLLYLSESVSLYVIYKIHDELSNSPLCWTNDENKTSFVQLLSLASTSWKYTQIGPLEPSIYTNAG